MCQVCTLKIDIKVVARCNKVEAKCIVKIGSKVEARCFECVKFAL